MKVRKRRIRDTRNGYLFISPWIIGFIIFTAYPIIAAIGYSFSEYNVLQPSRFVGIDNYRILFTQDSLFGKSVYNTIYYTIFVVLLGIIIALLLAVLLNQDLKGKGIFRTIFYLPVVVPVVASSMLWLWILNPQYGLLNALLFKIGIVGPGWVASVEWSKPAIIIMSLWGAGGTVIIFLAGLQGIPRQLYEAAEIDGANKWVKFSRITIPLLTPTILFNLIIGFIGSSQVFVPAFIMTDGGPLNSTLFYVLYLYRNAFNYFKMGYASAMAMILFVMIAALTLVLILTSSRWVHYE